MCSLAEYTSPQLIIPQTRNRHAAAITAELCSVMHRQGKIPDLLSFYNEVISHEFLSCTATETGIAIPHARLNSLPGTSFALGRAEEPVPWFGQHSPKVRLVFLFTAPERESDLYLSLVSALARLSLDQERLRDLLQAPGENELFAILGQIPVRLPRAAAVTR